MVTCHKLTSSTQPPKSSLTALKSIMYYFHGSCWLGNNYGFLYIWPQPQTNADLISPLHLKGAILNGSLLCEVVLVFFFWKILAAACGNDIDWSVLLLAQDCPCQSRLIIYSLRMYKTHLEKKKTSLLNMNPLFSLTISYWNSKHAAEWGQKNKCVHGIMTERSTPASTSLTMG